MKTKRYENIDDGQTLNPIPTKSPFVVVGKKKK
jgi:hypothetical protein